MRILVLDDDEVRHEQFAVNLKEHSVLHVRTTAEAGAALGAEKFDVVFLDHDLNDFSGDSYNQELTGFDVARFIAKYLAPQKRPDRVVVHSWNSAGARRMVAELREAGVPVTYEPFHGKSGSGQAQPPPTDTRPWVSLGSLADLKAETEGEPADEEDDGFDGPLCEECLDDQGLMLQCDRCFEPLCETCHDSNYGLCPGCDDEDESEDDEEDL